MIHKIKLNKDTELTFDTTDLPKDQDFNSLIQLVSTLPICTQYKIAYIYKSEYDYCKQILNNIKSDPKIKDMFHISLDMTHNKSINIKEEYGYKSYHILMGINSTKKKMYLQALSYFNKVQYKLGIEICYFYLGKSYSYTHEILKALWIFNTKDVKKIEVGKEMFRRNVPSWYFNSLFSNDKDGIYKNGLDSISNSNDISTTLDTPTNNIDGILKYINDNLSDTTLSMFPILNNDQYLYLKGKNAHLKGDYDKAVLYYTQSLSLRYNVYSKYNMCRIEQTECMEEEYDCLPYNNLKYYILYKKNKITSIARVDEDLKSFISINTGIKNSMESYIQKYKCLLQNKLLDRDVILSNMVYYKYKGIAYDKMVVDNEDIRILREVYTNSRKRNDISNYSNGSKDTQSNPSLPSNSNLDLIKVLKHNLFYLTKEEEYYDKDDIYSRMIYKYIKNKEIEECSIYTKLNEAQSTDSIQEYAECLSSVYGACGVGIILCKKGKFDEGMKIFNSVVLEYEDVYVNIGNVYVLKGEYTKGIMEYMKVLKRSNINNKSINIYIRNMIEKIYKQTDDILVLKKVYEKYPIEGIKEYIYKLMIEKGDEVEDKDLHKLYIQKETERRKEEDGKKRIREDMGECIKRSK